MNTKRMILLVPLMILASCGKPADPGGASSVGCFGSTSPRSREPHRPVERRVRNGPYVVCSIEGYKRPES